MRKTNHETPFQTITRDLNQAAVILAAGYHVEVYRQPAGRRALFAFDDTPHTRDLIARYETRKPIDIPAKTILQTRTELHHQAIRLCMEAL